MNKKIALLVIDPQNDFCDIPERERNDFAPALPVAGADADMKRLAAFIERAGAAIGSIHVTLDSHQPVDIAHPAWWVDGRGEAPAPFTLITATDIANGVWRARDASMQQDSLAYAQALEASGRYVLVVWPEHCLIGTWGNNIHSAVKRAIDKWGREQMAQVDYILKGMNPKTEHYSAIRAELPDGNDPSTMPNRSLLQKLSAADTVIVAGEALSHCVANTVRDIANDIGEENIRKLVLLADCASPVTGFEKLGADFLDEMRARGMQSAMSVSLAI
ncbi:MAG TPA: hypothetical protein VFW59_00045 [Gallionella sp.]|nr:hypothetical protein [Gallionella sp.]